MKFIVPAAVLAIVAATSVGCKHNGSTKTAAAEPSPAVTDITPIQPTHAQQDQAPVVVQPAPPADTTAAPVKSSSASGNKAPISGKKYTVQSGDTLFSIATRRYGHATSANLNKIRTANPSIHGDMLKVGQVLTLP